MFKQQDIAGIIPLAGYEVDYDFGVNPSLIPISKNWTAIENAVYECASVGCKTIWIVANDDVTPIIRHRIGSMYIDPMIEEAVNDTKIWSILKKNLRVLSHAEQKRKYSAIYYTPVPSKHLRRRNSFGWSVIAGVEMAEWALTKLSSVLAPSRYYVSFPNGIYNPFTAARERMTLKANNYYLTYEGKTIKDGLPLGFTITYETAMEVKKHVYRTSTGLRDMDRYDNFDNFDEWKDKNYKLPPEERYSARNFVLEEVFNCLDTEENVYKEVGWFHDIQKWDGYLEYMNTHSREECMVRPRDVLVKYREFNPIGMNDEEEEGDVEENI